MARTNKKGEIFSHVTEFAVYRDATGTFGSSTLSAAEAAGQTVLSFTSATNFDNGDYIRVGADEDIEIVQQASVSSNDVTVKWALGRTHAAGEAVVEQTRTALGHFTDEGVRLITEQDGEAIRSAVRRLELGQIMGHVGLMFEIALEGYNLENLCVALGMAENSVLGSGSAAAPHNLFADFSETLEETNLSFEAVGVRKDGVIERMQFLSCEVDVGALQLAFGRGKLVPIPLKFRVTSGVRFLQNTVA